MNYNYCIFVQERGFYEWLFSIPECTIISISSPTASSLLVQWNRLQGITNYFLDLRVVNDSATSPVVVSVPGSVQMKEVFGLKTGTWYRVVLKGFLNYNVLCTDVRLALTGNLLWFSFFFQCLNICKTQSQFIITGKKNNFYIMNR